MGTTPEPPRDWMGWLFSPSHTLLSGPIPDPRTVPLAKQRSPQQHPRPRPGHLLPRSCHSRLPFPHPSACLDPRWGPTLRARAPQRPREKRTWRPSRGKPALGGRCKQLMERGAGRVERSGAPGPAPSPAQRPHKPRPQAGLRPRPLSGSSSRFRAASLSPPLDPAVNRGSTHQRPGSRDPGPLELEASTRLHPTASAPSAWSESDRRFPRLSIASRTLFPSPLLPQMTHNRLLSWPYHFS